MNKVPISDLKEAKEERVFGQRAVWSKGHGNHMGQDETRVITLVSLLYQFLGISTPENKCMEIVRGIGGAPGT